MLNKERAADMYRLSAYFVARTKDAPVLKKEFIKKLWDEDADENDIKESWEDDDDEPAVMIEPELAFTNLDDNMACATAYLHVAQATKSPQEKNTRLENMSWRIWNLACHKRMLDEKQTKRLSKRCMEREKGLREAVSDMSEDLSEGEKGDAVSDISAQSESSTRGRFSRISSVDTMEGLGNQLKGKKMYIVLVSLHGLIRGENMELGRDSDTGGQLRGLVFEVFYGKKIRRSKHFILGKMMMERL